MPRRSRPDRRHLGRGRGDVSPRARARRCRETQPRGRDEIEQARARSWEESFVGEDRSRHRAGGNQGSALGAPAEQLTQRAELSVDAVDLVLELELTLETGLMLDLE